MVKFSCNLINESTTAVRSHGRFVIIGFALRRKAREGHVRRRVNTSGADRFRVVLSGKPPDCTCRNEYLASNSAMHMRKIIPLLLCKKLYNDKKSENDDQHYLNIIIDEAHNILSENSERESVQWKDYRLETFEEIIKEGRKFGVFLTLASQRPSDISPTIISQLHNYFLHRLINNEDINAVKQTISYLDRVSFEYLPLLPTGTCILAGLLANVPIVLDVGAIEPDKHEPKNKCRLREGAAPKSSNEEVRFLVKMLGDSGEVIRALLRKSKQLKLPV